MDQRAIAVTGVGLEIPSAEFEPQQLLGKKGLRYKDRATVLALCAVHRALENRGLLHVPPESRSGIGVCVSSNLGNMDTVCRESETIRKQHVDATSPMDLPVASSNVIPASVAIRYGFKGINLMLCNGATSGLDAVHLSARMLKSGRASKMVVVGVESMNPITQKLLSECDPDNPEPGPPIRCGELAAALILEPWEIGSGVEAQGFIGDYGFVSPGSAVRPFPTKPDVWFIPSQNGARSRDFVKAMQSDGMAGVPTMDASRDTGELYGALGEYQIVMALAHLRDSGTRRALISNGFTFGDGLSFLELTVSPRSL